MTKLQPILSKPECGWSTFTIDDFTFGVSYLEDTPQDFIDALVDVIKKREIRVIELDAEGETCLVVLYPYSGVYTIIHHSDEDIKIRYFPINMIRIAERLIKDIELYKEEWANWQSFGEEELKKYYNLSELKELIKD